MHKSIITLTSFISCLVLSCGPVADMQISEEVDISPPQFQNITSIGITEIKIEFNESAFLEEESLVIDPLLEVLNITQGARSLTIFTSDMMAGEHYTIEATAADTGGNSITFAAAFYGFNPRKPELKINEFTTQGSKTHPDLVELKILSAGDMAGITIYQGTASNWTDRFVFPRLEVESGDFILVHFKPEKISAEINETRTKTESGGLDASSTAYDFWVRDGNGISGNNGVISIYDQPMGEIVDGVLYSNRTSESDTRYDGFGSANTKMRALELQSAEEWITETGTIRPEDGINPEDSSATRSICRQSTYTDTNSKTDWHIVPTGKASFGRENCNEVFIP
jgi:hypothetical protein